MSTPALVRVAAVAAPRRGRVALSAALSLGAVLAAVALMATSGFLIVRAAQQPAILALGAAIAGVRAFAVTRAGLRYAERLVSHDLALRLLGDVRARFYARLAPLVPGTLPQARSGDLLSRFVADVDELQHLFVRGLTPPLVALGTILAAGGATAWLVAPRAGLVLAAVLLAGAIVLPAATALANRRAARRQADARAHLTTELVEALDGSAELAVLGLAPDRLARIEAADDRLRRLALRDALATGTAAGLGTVLSGVAALAVLVATVPLIGEGRVDGVLLGMAVLLGLAAAEGIAPLGEAARRLGSCAAAAARITEITDRAPAVPEPADPRPLPPGTDLAAEGLVVAADGRVVLDGVSLDLVPGRAVGVVGASGSGKTTLGRVLVGLRAADGGTVRLGGVDVRELAGDDLRRVALLAEQDARVFAGTVRANLLLADPGADEARLWAALAQVELDEVVAALPDGLDTACGDDGDAFSGGERRRLLLARALVSRARVLILDEPVAHLPAALGARILARLAAVATDEGRAVLVLGHAAADLEAFDEVGVLRDGRLHPA